MGSRGHQQPYLTLVDFNTTRPVYTKRRKHALRHEGFTEPLLCCTCDQNLIGTAENYVRKCLYGVDKVLKHIAPSKSHRRYVTSRGRVVREGYDKRWVNYALFKRFQLSLLWRASIATGRSFNEIRSNLPTSTKEKMRLALLHGIFDEDFLPCLMVRLDGFVGDNFGIIQPPVLRDGFVQFILGGYEWNYFLDSKTSPMLTLTKDGRLLVAIRDIERLYTPDN